MKQFRAYLQALPTDQRPDELREEELGTFHYGEWLLAQGFNFKLNREQTPLYWDYIRFQRQAITGYFREMTAYARAYAAEQGRSVEVSANFFNCLDQYYALEPEVDLIMTEMRNTRYRQPTWYRYIRGFAGDKPVVVVENPYGGVIPELVDKLQHGEGYDLFRMSLYEAAALGTNMSVPYGSWMGSIQEDAFYAPHDLCVEIQDFLARNEGLFSPRSLADTAVVYSVESNFYGGARPEELANNPENVVKGNQLAFWDVCDRLADARQPYDVRCFADGTLREDDPRHLDLAQYRTVILPRCHFLTDAQATALEQLLDRGGRVVALGAFGENLDEERQKGMMQHAGVTLLESAGALDLTGGAEAQVVYEGDSDLAINVVPVEGGVAIHLIRYGYDEAADRVPVLPSLELTVRLDGDFASLRCVSPDASLTGSMRRDGDRYRISLANVPLYGIAVLEHQA
jgi:hypothetical protein